MKIKRLIIMAAAATLTAFSANADNWWSNHFNNTNDANEPPFRANEFSIDAFGSFIGHERNFLAWPNTSIRSGLWGGGVGANYFWSKDVGIGVDTSMQDGEPRFFDHVGGNLIVRFPIQQIRLAPYVFAGGGRSFDPGWNWFGDGGVGLEIRLHPNFGIFGDARYIWKDVGGQDEALIRAGIRLAF